MLDSNILSQVSGIFAALDADFTLAASVSQSREEAAEITEFLRDFASTSPRLSVTFSEATGDTLEFSILKNGEPTGVKFRGIPNGHEFTSLLLAILNADGKGKNLPDEAITRRIKALAGEVKLQTFVSLSCTNCPDIVQALNIMAILNPAVTHEMIDGALFQQEADAMKIQAVPTVYVNGKMLHVGRGTLG
ncbi:MAG: thioredoxin family protein, partial [Muribaculaceae bacterium]|nr:thioredoxin family protein [Muribaculaceae bacterium]